MKKEIIFKGNLGDVKSLAEQFGLFETIRKKTAEEIFKELEKYLIVSGFEKAYLDLKKKYLGGNK